MNGLVVVACGGLVVGVVWSVRPDRKESTSTPFLHSTQKNQPRQDDGDEITFDFENDDDDEADAAAEAGIGGGSSQAPTPDDDPYVLWPPELEKMPLGDICFLLRSGVIAAKNVPERRAGTFLCVACVRCVSCVRCVVLRALRALCCVACVACVAGVVLCSCIALCVHPSLPSLPHASIP